MQFLSWLGGLKPVSSRQRTQRGPPRYSRRQPVGCKLSLETLEDRSQPSFLAPVNYAADLVPYGSTAVLTADFNGDGRLDLAVTNVISSTVSVMLGNADGTFQPARISARVYADSLAVGDFDGNGKLDLASVGGFPSLSVLRGNGDGTFQAPTSIDVGPDASAESVAVGDFNADGKLDLGVLSEVGGTAYSDGAFYANVLLGNGDGSFSAPSTTLLGSGGRAPVVVGDFNGDGKLDLATANSDYWSPQGTVNVLLGDGIGNLQPPADFSTGSSWPQSVVAGDVNGDGNTDLVTASPAKTVSVLLGDGLGSFGSAQIYATGDDPDSVVLGDFNRDGRLDLILIDATNTNSNGNVLFGIGGGAFSAPQSFATGPYPFRVVAGDFNGDGWLDAATRNRTDVSVLINDTHWPPADLPSVSINDVSVTEGNTGAVSATFTVSLSSAYGQPVTVNFATADGAATAGSDYRAKAGTLTFAPGQTSQTITVEVIGDRLPEPTETFVVNLSNPTNSVIADGQGVATIVDDEPRISISDVSKSEGKKNQSTLFTFTVTLSAAYDQPVTMSFRTVDGTATTSDSDYVAKTGTLTFNPGETSKTITIVVNGDNKKEADETFFLDLFGNSSNSLFTKNRGLGTILNDD
jgi:Calx-beta domain/FG-GAP-like repeat/FG-GAP repeat